MRWRLTWGDLYNVKEEKSFRKYQIANKKPLQVGLNLLKRFGEI